MAELTNTEIDTMRSTQIVRDNLARLMKMTPSCKTQQQMADRSGLSKATVGRILNEDVSATAETITALAKGLGVEPYELLIDRSKPNKERPSGTGDTFESIRDIMKNWSESDIDKFLGMIELYKKMRS